MKITIKHIALAFIVFLLFLPVGIYIPHYISKQNSFVGVVGGHIYVDNTSGERVGDTELQGCWSMLYHGAPGPVLEFGRLITQRIKITYISGLEDYCGSCTVKLYTIFNIPYLTDPLHRGCA